MGVYTRIYPLTNDPVVDQTCYWLQVSSDRSSAIKDDGAADIEEVENPPIPPCFDTQYGRFDLFEKRSYRKMSLYSGHVVHSTFRQMAHTATQESAECAGLRL